MKIIFCLSALIFLTSFANAQHEEHFKDSLSYYQKEHAKISRAYRDSFQRNETARGLRANMIRLRAASDNYTAFTLSGQVSSADFDILNADISSGGFSPFKGIMFGAGYGFSFKKNRRIFDLNIISFGLSKKKKANDETVSVSYTTGLQLEWGYDLIRNKLINIYPYAGIGLRSTTLDYEAKAVLNPNPTGITDIVQNNASVGDVALEVGYQAGMGFEYVFTNPTSVDGALLFIKGGTNRAFKKAKYDLEDIRYDPGFKFGDWMISFGIKLFSR